MNIQFLRKSMLNLLIPMSLFISTKAIAINERALRAEMVKIDTIIPVANAKAVIKTTVKQEEPAFSVVEEMPEFPGGVAARTHFFDKNLISPKTHPTLSGRVIASFIVNTDGSIQDIIILKSLRSDYDQEAVRVVNLMPKWKPGRQSGRVLRVKYILPVVFK